jgi:glycosyltransferase involved in cell wall biosynthesis
MELSNTPKVSVIIPVYNGERFIRQSIQSVVEQGYDNLEIVCVDDGSTDNTRSLIAKEFPQVSYVYQANKGPAAARNLGMRSSTGEYIAFLDSDDIWLPGKLSAQIECMRQHDDAKISHTNINLKVAGKLGETIYPIATQDGRIFEGLLLHTGSVVCSTLLLKRECIDNVGYFDEELRTSEDVHLFLRLAYRYEFHFLKQPLVTKVHHGANLTSGTNPYFGAGTLLALEKIERLFPEYSRENSKVMRRAFYLRARLIASSYEHKGDHDNARRYLAKALEYDGTLRNRLSVLKHRIELRLKRT